MRRSSWLASAGAVLTLLSACGSSDSGNPSNFQNELQGSWSNCIGGSGQSARATLTVTGLNYTSTLQQWASNTTCTGAADVSNSQTGTLKIGSSVNASLGSTTVSAHQVDDTSGGVTSYGLAYIDTGATPDRLYVGDNSGTNDGSTPQLRPTSLDATGYLLKQ